jgi:hypothetical protein
MNSKNVSLNNIGIYKMKIKNKTQTKLMFIALAVLFALVIYQIRNPIVVKKQVPVHVPVEVPVQIPVERGVSKTTYQRV